MATIQQPAIRSASRERGPPSTSSFRPPIDSDRNSVRNGDSIRSLDENLGPPGMTKALQGMLKSTTETGDIGLFSIKASRVPPANNPRRISGAYNDDPLQKHRHFQPYGVSNTDDRRRLPSYSRDASSEVISMYETASQKSANRAFDDPDYRSYSMSQTYSSYSLNNHRSYTSLRSQPDTGGLFQRPRSPFAYPARLRRPGFRPSSPALTDGGVIDYSRRAEIDRIPYGANHHTSSPASLYAQKRRPPLSLRPEGNRSTPSLLSQSSPQRRSPSPRSRHRSGTPNNDWHRRTGPASYNTSPARSTFSLASTVNLSQIPPAPSTTTTPGKVPPSPLYYDYTEDFDVDEHCQPEVLEPPPQFRIEKTIPEDRPLSSEWPSSSGSDLQDQKSDFSINLQHSSSATCFIHKSTEAPESSGLNSPVSSTETLRRSACQVEAYDDAKEPEKATLNPRDTKTIRLSGLGLGARELSSHVEEAFGLPSSPSFEVLVSDNTAHGKRPGNIKTALDGLEVETQSNRTSAHSLNTHLGKFPPPPQTFDGQYSEENDQTSTLMSDELNAGLTEMPLGRNDYSGAPRSHTQAAKEDTHAPTEQFTVNFTAPHSSRSASLQTNENKLGRPDSGGAAFDNLDELIKSFEDGNGAKKSGEETLPRHTKLLPAIPSGHTLGTAVNTSSTQLLKPLLASSHLMMRELTHKELSDSASKRGHHYHKPRRLETMTLPLGSENDVPNFSHQFPRKLISRSESPMLAPKPISPARQLRLKNSVPQLMKALPPLPPDTSFIAVSPPDKLAFSEGELPCRFSPLIPESRAVLSQEPLEAAELDSSENIERVITGKQTPAPVELDSLPTDIDGAGTDPKAPSLPLPKLKLKMRSSSTLRPTSPPESRPWNSEDNYPWSTQSFSVGLPPVVQENKTSKHPKFRLKITRASNSTLGTVRINRESAESRPAAGLQMRHNKDLFTPASGFDNIFRQVSSHLHSRKASATSNHLSDGSRRKQILPPTSGPLSSSQSMSSDLSSPQDSPLSLHARSPTEIRSFFSDDRYRIRKHDLRKRISNLRARFAVPYGATGGTQSHDDITWRDRNGPEAPIPSFSRSIPNIGERASTEATPPRRLVERIHAQKLRTKFTIWFKEARSALRTRVKSRKASGRASEE